MESESCIFVISIHMCQRHNLLCFGGVPTLRWLCEGWGLPFFFVKIAFSDPRPHGKCRVFAFRPKETGGAVLQHQHCYGDIGESQKASRLQWNESHPSGTPAIWENNGRTEILLLVHNLDRVAFGWRQRHNWAVRVDRRTLRATHVSKGPILKSRAKPEGSGGVRGGVCDGRLSVGSYHVSGDRMRLMLGSEDKYSCWQDIDLGGITWQPLVPLEKVALEAFPVGESSLV